jgi:hypothetical protein
MGDGKKLAFSAGSMYARPVFPSCLHVPLTAITQCKERLIFTGPASSLRKTTANDYSVTSEFVLTFQNGTT